MIIAIDGYSSCGKSTLARQLASKLNFLFIDTGAMYRTVTLYLIDQAIPLDDLDQITKALPNINIQLKKVGDAQEVWLNGVDVTRAVRMPQVAAQVSTVAAIGVVREELVRQQRLFAEDNDIVMDGRDIGTVVFPNAHLKIFVTASVEERVSRRLKEELAKGLKSDYQSVKANLLERDRIDSSRKHSPLRRAVDAYLLDNTLLTRQEQLDVALELAK